MAPHPRTPVPPHTHAQVAVREGDTCVAATLIAHIPHPALRQTPWTARVVWEAPALEAPPQPDGSSASAAGGGGDGRLWVGGRGAPGLGGAVWAQGPQGGQAAVRGGLAGVPDPLTVLLLGEARLPRGLRTPLVVGGVALCLCGVGSPPPALALPPATPSRLGVAGGVRVAAHARPLHSCPCAALPRRACSSCLHGSLESSLFGPCPSQHRVVAR